MSAAYCKWLSGPGLHCRLTVQMLQQSTAKLPDAYLQSEGGRRLGQPWLSGWTRPSSKNAAASDSALTGLTQINLVLTNIAFKMSLSGLALPCHAGRGGVPKKVSCFEGTFFLLISHCNAPTDQRSSGMKGPLAILAISLILAQGQEQVALPDSNVEPAITGLASTSFFEYASSVAVQLIKVRLALQLAILSQSTTCLIQAH